VLEVGSTAEGASLLTAMLGTKEFPYPKPLSLTQALVQQATRPGDIVVDFFAGSGTTGHAVLAVNGEDGGTRRFVLVSSTEATEKLPERNVCRDVCHRRMEKAIRGYSYTTKKGLKEVPGLGGDFAYLRCHRIEPGRLTDIDHAQVWTALQLIHCEAISAYEEGPILRSGDEEQLLIYLPLFRRSHGAALRKAVKESRSVIIYSWQPEIVRQQLHTEPHVQVQAVPENLARRFGIKV
jgi:adenine-specific DNA-methyltransferase